MAPDTLVQIAEILYGKGRWAVPIARELGVDRRTVKRWSDGTTPIPGDLSTRLYQLLDDHHHVVAVLQRSLEADVAMGVVMSSRDRWTAGIAKSLNYDSGKGDPNE